MANFNVDTSGNLWIGTGVSDSFSTAQSEANTKFYVTSAGAIYAVSGHIGGIVIDANGMESSNYDASTDTGWRFDNDTATVFAYKIDLKIEGGAADPPTVETQKLDIGSARIYEFNSNLILDASGTGNDVVVKTGDRFRLSGVGSDPTMLFDGAQGNVELDLDQVTDGTTSSGRSYTTESLGYVNELTFKNQDVDIFRINAQNSDVYFYGQVEIAGDFIPNNLKAYNGFGSSGQTLQRTSNGLEWVSSSGSHSDSDHTSFSASGHDHDSDYMSAGDTSHGTHIPGYGSSGSSTDVARSDHSHTSSGVSSISAGGSGMTGAIAFTGTGSGFFDTISQDTQQVKFTRSGVSSVKLRPASSTATYGLGDSTYRWLILYSQFASNTSSDENLKENIAVSDLGLDFINDLQPKKFTYIRQFGWVCENTEEQVEAEDSECNSCDEDTDCDVKWVDVTGIEEDAISYGLIAQDVEALQPEGTNWNLVRGEGDETKSLAYSEFISPLVKAVQELSTQISDLTARIEVLEG
tara:strand:+ start:5211 stop:6776 length:1566 start_codon:yes stop_codon:yes gene_type:complete